ncbi:MAG: type II toxin-antitoxin system VapC family toxin [Candidatus Levyibacteriota bacterium]
MTKTFVDANILLELMFKRQKLEIVSNLLAASDRHFLTSSLSIHLLYHFGQKAGYSQEVMKGITAMVEVLPLDDYVVKLAQQHYKGKDFEDCLQDACAEAGECKEIVTLDRKFREYSGTKLKVTVL